MRRDYFAPDFSVNIEGLTISGEVSNAVIDLTYESNLDAADMFTVRLNNADLSLTDSPLLTVGKMAELRMGYAGDLKKMMLGEITAISPTFPQGGAPSISITGYDKSHRMRHNQPGRTTFKWLNDSAIAAQIAAENLLVPIVDPAPMPPKPSVQQTGSDWAFLKELADRNFFQVYVFWDRIYFRFPRPQTEMVVLEWGKNLNSFSPRLSTSGQVGLQVIRGYDYKLAQKIVAILPAVSLGESLDSIVERMGDTFVEQLVGLGRHVVRDQPVESFLDATVMAKSVLSKLLQGLYEGTGSCIGVPELRAGQMVEIRNVGKRYSGTYTLSKVTHAIGEGGYQTSFDVTQKYTGTLLQSLRTKIAESPSPNKREPAKGVVIGIVENNVDPDQLGRVQLSFPHLSDSNLSAWARVATEMAGDNYGSYFLPERGEEVLVTFIQDNVDHPVVIGRMWNGTARPPETNADGNNRVKTIRTKSGMSITFDETEDAENLTIQDKAGSTVTMDSATGDLAVVAKASASMKSQKGLAVTLDATENDEKITLAAGKETKIDISNDGSVVIKASNIELNAEAGTIVMKAKNVDVTVAEKMDVH